MRNFLFGKTAIRNTMKFTTLFCFGLSVAMTVACRSSDQHSERRAGTESPLVSNDISNQQIKAIAEDAQGHIWLGTFRGLNKYNAHEPAIFLYGRFVEPARQPDSGSDAGF